MNLARSASRTAPKTAMGNYTLSVNPKNQFQPAGRGNVAPCLEVHFRPEYLWNADWQPVTMLAMIARLIEKGEAHLSCGLE